MEINKSAVIDWVIALRSGEYQQGTSYLNKDSRLCCLGVTCEVAIKHGVDLVKTKGFEGCIRYDETTGSLPQTVQVWLGILGDRPKVTYKNELRSLAVLNDIECLSFNEIAGLIEKEYLFP